MRRSIPGAQTFRLPGHRGLFLALSALVLAPMPVHAAPMPYTDAATFLAALPGPAQTLDFDSEAPLSLIPSGGSLDGITFVYDFGGVSLEISNDFDTTSPPNTLGTDDGGVLQDGDDFDLQFAPQAAVGMYFLTADALLDDDIVLTAGGVDANLVAADLQTTLPDGTDVYFLGLIDPMGTFTQASITTLGGGFFLYNVDDIVIAILPEPSSALLVGAGLLLCAAPGRRPN